MSDDRYHLYRLKSLIEKLPIDHPEYNQRIIFFKDSIRKLLNKRDKRLRDALRLAKYEREFFERHVL